VFVLKKNPKATKSKDHRINNLIARNGKTVAMILRRIERKVEDVLGEAQFEF
jgi:predicted DNA-binding protein